VRWFPVFFGLLVFACVPLLIAQEGDSLDWDIDAIFGESPGTSPNGKEVSGANTRDPGVSTLVRGGTREEDTSDWDIDAIFDEPPDTSGEEEDFGEDAEGFTVSALIRRRGFTLSASYGFSGGIAPGWNEAPWFSGEGNEAVFTFSPGVKMTASLGLDVQISEVFRVKTSVGFTIPKFAFTLGDFFFDYIFYDTVFVRGGKYGLTWGISPNYGFTNLLARIPAGGAAGESFILKADMPIGIGGIQVLGQTRANLMGGVIPKREDVGLGGKYNLALRWADFDLGVFYQKGMPPRGFLSIKTTLGNTELFHEWMIAFNFEDPRMTNGAANIGFVRDFFDNRLTLNGELFFNAEENAWGYTAETDIRDAYTSPFIDGLNMALGLIYRLDGRGSPRLVSQFLYAPMENSAQFVPGFRLNPWPHIEFYAAMPMALGSRDGYYYTHTFILDNQNRPRRFSLMMLLSLSGTFQYGHYF
jgi:hypothetical protein